MSGGSAASSLFYCLLEDFLNQIMIKIKDFIISLEIIFLPILKWFWTVIHFLFHSKNISVSVLCDKCLCVV